jgi:hypothetical protein
MEVDNSFYVYIYLRENGTPYYIGKGKRNRAYSSDKMVDLPSKDRIKIVLKNLTEEQAFCNEKDFIDYYGRLDINTGILENRTSGGEGSTGFRHTEEWKKKLRTESNFITNNPGKNKSEETLRKLREKSIELHKDPEYIKKYRGGLVTRVLDKELISNRTKEAMAQPEVRQKFLESLKTRKVNRTPESIAKMLETKRINGTLNPSEETKKKISESHKGKKMSDAARKKMSESFKGRVPWNKGKRYTISKNRPPEKN